MKMKMKMFYFKPQVEVIEFELQDSVLNVSTLSSDSATVYGSEDAF